MRSTFVRLSMLIVLFALLVCGRFMIAAASADAVEAEDLRESCVPVFDLRSSVSAGRMRSERDDLRGQADPAAQLCSDAQTPFAAAVLSDTADRSQKHALLMTVLPIALVVGTLAAVVFGLISKKKGLKIFLFILAALLLSGGIGAYWYKSKKTSAPSSVLDDSLPDPVLYTQPEYADLTELDLRQYKNVTADYVDAVRSALPGCRVIWNVPLTDGVFDSNSASLTLPHFSPSDAQMLRFFPDLTRVDATGSDAYDSLLELSRSGIEVVFTMPVGDQILSTEDASLVLTGAPDLSLLTAMLPAFPALRTVDLSAADVPQEAAFDFAKANPSLTVLRSVTIGTQQFSAASEALTLSDPIDADLLSEALSCFDDLQRVDLHGSVTDPDALLRLTEAFPSITFSFAADWNGTIEADTETLDLSDCTDPAETIAARLKLFPKLRTVRLPDMLSEPDAILQFETAYPDTLFLHDVVAFSQTLSNDIETLDVSRMRFNSPEQVEAEIAKLPLLKKLVMCDCGLSNEQMAALRDSHPSIKFVWMLHIAKHSLRTDAIGFSTKNPSKYTSPYATDEYNNLVRTTVRLKKGDLDQLRYCTDLEALDVGHNYLTNDDLSVLQYLPHLKILILADNCITDISALSQLKELMYVELFMNRIPDISPLVGLENLIDINVCYIHLTDTAPLYQFKQAERLWFGLNGISSDEIRAISEALPNCVCNGTVRDSTGDGWREHPRYRWMRNFFNQP